MSEYRIIPDKAIPGPIATAFSDPTAAKLAAEQICRDHTCRVSVCLVVGYYAPSAQWTNGSTE